MKEFARHCLRAAGDARFIIGLGGVLLSIAVHELFHVIVHWGEIDGIYIFSDSHAIVEVIFTPTDDYDLAVEEAIAYIITMVTLILTALLISDVHDARDKREAKHIVLTDDFMSRYPGADEQKALEHLAGILGAKSKV